MSAVAAPILPADPVPGQPPQEPVEYVRSLPPEAKEAIFLELIREAIRLNGGRGLIPVDGPGGERLGFYVPPDAADELANKVLPKFSPEREAEIERRLATAGPTIRGEDLLAELKQAAPRPPQ